MGDLKNKHIVLTGATSGIGKSLALQLAKEGCVLSICGRSEDKMKELIGELKVLTERPVFYRSFCVSSEKDIIDFVNDAYTANSKVDFLILSAGLNSAKAKVADILTEDFDWMVKINLRAPFIFMREVYNKMLLHKTGTILNILSSVCLFSNETLGSYTASKSGIESLTNVFRKEARIEGIKVCAVYPGGVDTPFRAVDRPDYMSSESVATTIVAQMKLPEDVVLHEIVFRPMVEANF